MPCCCILPEKAYLKRKPQVLVITNYRPDQQKSMLRFGDLLISNSPNHRSFNIQEIYPASVFRKICPIEKLRKWAAYVDKYLLFPKRLKRNLISRKDPLHLILLHLQVVLLKFKMENQEMQQNYLNLLKKKKLNQIDLN